MFGVKRAMNNGLIPISEFAEFSRTTRDKLLNYEKMGLLTPVSRGHNKYRFYTVTQLAVVNVIRTLQEMGMTLAEIRNQMDRRTPEGMEELFASQIDKIDAKIDDWVRARKLLYTLNTAMQSVMRVDEKEITVRRLPAEAIILGGLNDYSQGRNDYDALLTFYHAIHEQYPDLNLNYPVWGTFSEQRLKRGDWVWPDRYYFYNPEGHDRRPAALYAIGYTRGGYGQSDELYKRMVRFFDQNNYEICGDGYEEYPHNEVCVADDRNYLMRVMIPVREK